MQYHVWVVDDGCEVRAQGHSLVLCLDKDEAHDFIQFYHAREDGTYPMSIAYWDSSLYPIED